MTTIHFVRRHGSFISSRAACGEYGHLSTDIDSVTCCDCKHTHLWEASICKLVAEIAKEILANRDFEWFMPKAEREAREAKLRKALGYLPSNVKDHRAGKYCPTSTNDMNPAPVHRLVGQLYHFQG